MKNKLIILSIMFIHFLFQSINSVSVKTIGYSLLMSIPHLYLYSQNVPKDDMIKATGVGFLACLTAHLSMRKIKRCFAKDDVPALEPIKKEKNDSDKQKKEDDKHPKKDEHDKDKPKEKDKPKNSDKESKNSFLKKLLPNSMTSPEFLTASLIGLLTFFYFKS